MKERETNYIQVDTAEFAPLIMGLERLTGGVHQYLCGSTQQGVLQADKNKTEKENAYDWVVGNYDIVSGTVELAFGISNMLSFAFGDYNVKFEEL